MWKPHYVSTFILFAIVTAANASPACLTKEEARAAYKTAHLYWHGKAHCWNALPPRSESKPQDISAPRRFSSPELRSASDQNRNPKNPSAPGISSNPGPTSEILFPPLVIGGDFYIEMLKAQMMTGWPLLIDVDAETGRIVVDIDHPDPDRGIDGCCWPSLQSLRLEDLYAH